MIITSTAVPQNQDAEALIWHHNHALGTISVDIPDFHRIKIYDTTGILLLSERNKEVHIDELPYGICIMKVEDVKGKSFVDKFIK